jgi:hypothetical protein
MFREVVMVAESSGCPRAFMPPMPLRFGSDPLRPLQRAVLLVLLVFCGCPGKREDVRLPPEPTPDSAADKVRVEAPTSEGLDAGAGPDCEVSFPYAAEATEIPAGGEGIGQRVLLYSIGDTAYLGHPPYPGHPSYPWPTVHRCDWKTDMPQGRCWHCGGINPDGTGSPDWCRPPLTWCGDQCAPRVGESGARVLQDYPLGTTIEEAVDGSFSAPGLGLAERLFLLAGPSDCSGHPPHDLVVVRSGAIVTRWRVAPPQHLSTSLGYPGLANAVIVRVLQFGNQDEVVLNQNLMDSAACESLSPVTIVRFQGDKVTTQSVGEGQRVECTSAFRTTWVADKIFGRVLPTGEITNALSEVRTWARPRKRYETVPPLASPNP